MEVIDCFPCYFYPQTTSCSPVQRPLQCHYANVMYFVLLCLAGQLAVGTCEIVMLNRDSSVPRRTIARQTARCACRRGQIAGTTRARPACVDGEFNDLSSPGGSRFYRLNSE